MIRCAVPSWPKGMPRRWFEVPFSLNRRITAYDAMDLRAVEQAQRVRREYDATMGGVTSTWSEQMFSNFSDHTAYANLGAEGSLIGGRNLQPFIPANYFLTGGVGQGKAITLITRGVLGTVSTPTVIFQWRLGTTSGSTFLSGASVGVSAAITTQSGVSTKQWESRLDIICNVPGIGSGNTTLNCCGYVRSASGFASPFEYAMQPTTPESGTWTATIDGSLNQFVNLSATWSAANASNTITCKFLQMLGWN